MIKTKAKHINLFVCLLSFLSLPAQQPDTTRIYDIPEITVIEKQNASEIRSTTPFQILSADKIGQLNALLISDAIKHFSGVTVKDYGGIGGLKTVSVRSLGANHTTVNYDGIAISDVQTGQIDIGRFSLDNVESISLNSGQSDNIFLPARSFASASVLNIRTLSPQFQENERLKGKAVFKSGSFGLINPALTINGKINSTFSSAFSGEYMYSNGEYPFEFRYGTNENDSTEILKRKNTDVRNIRLETAIYGNFSEKENACFKAYYYQSERGLPGNVTFYNPQNNSNQRVEDKTFFAQAHYRREFSKYLAFQANGKYNWSWMHYLDSEYLSTSGKIDNTYAQQEYYLSASLLYRAFERLSFSFSSDGFVNTMDSDLEGFAYPARCSLLSVAAVKYAGNRVLATASILNTLVKEEVKYGTLPENHNHFSPYFSLSIKPFLSQDLRVRVFYKNIFRLPTFNDLYYTNVGNTALKPETTQQYNVGLTYTASIGPYVPVVSATVDAYHNAVDNKIVALPSKKDIFLWSMINFGKVSVNGIDLNVETTIQATKKLAFIAGTSYTYQRALNETDQTDRYTYKHQIPYTPRVSGSAKAGMETKWVNVYYSLIWSGHRYTFPQNYTANRLEAYSDHSLSFSRDFKLSIGKLSASIEALNLSDKNYQVVRGFPMPGRSFRVSMGLSF